MHHSAVDTTSFTSSFFYVSGHPRHILSFPTRRSSDLSCGSSTSRCCWAASPSGCSCGARARGCPSRSPAPSPRSEEHTSELQSRGQLVCRLLLEKKNKIKAGHVCAFKKKKMTTTNDTC